MSLSAIRRIYFYLVAFIAMLAAVAAVDGLLRVLSDIWLNDVGFYSTNATAFLRNQIARNASLLVVAAPLFLLHWHFAQRRIDDPDERFSALRKLFLYASSLVATGYLLYNAFDLLRGVAFLALGGPPSASDILPAAWLHQAAMVLVGFGLLYYWDHIIHLDGDYGTETGPAGSIRRLFHVIMGLAGLALILFGASQIVQALWENLVGSQVVQTVLVVEDWGRSQVADGLATLLLGAVLARVNWRRWEAVVANQDQEARAALRRVYFYVAVVISALATLLPTGNALNELLLILFGAGTNGGGDLLLRLGDPLSLAPFGLAAWIWHWRVVRNEALRYGETPEAATVRRLYYYAVAATGLGLFWFGAVDLLQALLDVTLSTAVTDGTTPIWAEPLANGISLLAVGIPVWFVHWRTAQSVAQGDDESGRQERASLPRKIYLYGVTLVGALLILYYLAQVLYRFLLVVLGDPAANLVSAATADELARSLIAAAFWVVHVLAIRSDSRRGERVALPLPTEAPTDPRAELTERIARLEDELAAARRELAELEAATAQEDAPAVNAR